MVNVAARQIGRRGMMIAAGAAMAEIMLPGPLLRAQSSLRTISIVATFGTSLRGEILRFSVTRDDKSMLTITNTEAKLWDLAKRLPIRSMQLQPENMLDADCVADGTRAIITYGNKVQLWDLVQARIIRTITPEGARIERAAVAPDGRYLAIAQDRMLSLWDLRDGTRIGSRDDPHEGVIVRLAFSPDVMRLACAYLGTLRLYEIPSLVLEAEFDLSANVGGLAFSPDGRLVVQGERERIRVFEAVARLELATIQGPENSFFSSVALFRNGRSFVAGDSDGHFFVGSVTSASLLAKSADPPPKPRRIAISPDQRYAYVGSGVDGRILVFDVSFVT
jgi:WD40 repeat protein